MNNLEATREKIINQIQEMDCDSFVEFVMDLYYSDIKIDKNILFTCEKCHSKYGDCNIEEEDSVCHERYERYYLETETDVC